MHTKCTMWSHVLVGGELGPSTSARIRTRATVMVRPSSNAARQVPDPMAERRQHRSDERLFSHSMEEFLVAEDLLFTRTERREGPADLLQCHGHERRIFRVLNSSSRVKTGETHPMCACSSGLQVAHSHNHCSNQETMAHLANTSMSRCALVTKNVSRGCFCWTYAHCTAHRISELS